MASKLAEGTEGIGHIQGLSDALHPAFLRLDNRGAIVSIPRVGAVGDLFTKFLGRTDNTIPITLRFHDTNGSCVLAECRDVGGSVSTLGTGLTRIRARRVIEAGNNDADYVEVDGMASEIDGLSSWSGMSTVTQTTDFSSWVNLRADSREAITLGGDPKAAIESSFSYNPSPKGNVFGITDLSLLRTRTEGFRPWREHAAVHHMFQDLMCLTYGRPCLSRIVSIKREDDQPYQMEGARQRLWRKVYEPAFGRSVDGIDPLDRAKAEPLFRLSDVDRSALGTWIDEWNLWSRPTWIAVTTMFQMGTTVESKLLQVGVALEALGYALWQDSNPNPGDTTPAYPALLERVTTTANVDHPEVFGGRTVDVWRREFNGAFKGIKHADNTLPDGMVAHEFANQGFNLIRAWLGTRLGVSADVLKHGFDRRSQ